MNHQTEKWTTQSSSVPKTAVGGHVFFALCFCLSFTSVASAQGLVVDQIHWGFDSNVVVGRFNPLAITVTNPTPRPMPIEFTLSQGRGLGRVGPDYVEQAYLGPNTTRILRFYPFIMSNYDEWYLRWGKRGSAEIPAPPHGQPASIILNDPNAFVPTAKGIRAMADNFFPPNVAATAPLASVILDHNPRFDAAVAQAFMDWIRLGGRVCLIKGVGDSYPRFVGALTPLNNSADSFRIGAGHITRHNTVRADLNKNVIERTLGLGSMVTPKQKFSFVSTLETPIIDILEQFTRIQHNWFLIYSVATLFVFLIGPIHYWRVRKGLNYQTSIVVLLIAVAVFSWAFFSIGRRGYGEEGGTYTIAHARSLTNNRFLVTQYNNAFVTTGGQYAIGYNTEQSLFAAPQLYESVNGSIASGAKGVFLVDIPVFSNRGYMHAGVFTSPDIPMEFSAARNGENMSVALDPAFLDSALIFFAVRGEEYWPLQRKEDRLVFTDYAIFIEGMVDDLDDLKRGSLPSQLRYRRVSMSDDPVRNETLQQDAFNQLAKPLAAEHLNIIRQEFDRKTSKPKATPSDALRLFILAPLPDAFALNAQGLTQNDSYVLYDLEVPVHDAN